MWSSYYGHYATVQLLLAQPNVNPSQSNNFAIRNAFKNGHLPVVNLLFADPRLDRSNIPTIVDFMNNNTTIPDPSGTRTQTNDLTSQTNDTQSTELFATIRSKISSSNLIPNLRSQISNLSIRSRKRYSLISLFRRNATDMEDLAETDTDESTDLDECSDAIDTETTIPPVNLASNNIPNPHTTIPSTTDILDDWVSISASDIQSIPQHTGIDCGACSPELQMCGMDTLLQDTTGEDVCVMETEYIPSVVSNQ
ncbi:hypothetical protein HDV02_004010 [Globomyces sp. JEL0801]|nr:hypothetical protein HDV02_004010 [Globomyces sp. JEL0801]